MRIFISYRRDDSIYIAGWIYERLVARLGRDAIFKDVDSIPPGMDFRRHLHQAVQQCDVLLAVIGREWADIHDGKGERRLWDERDFVRIEIEAALLRDIPVIPLLVGGASMPQVDQLPPSLHDLCYRQALAVRPDPDFHRDVDRLIAALEKLPERQHTAQAMPPAMRAHDARTPPRLGEEWPARIVNSLGNVLVRVPKVLLPGIPHAGERAYVSTTSVTNRDYLAFVRESGWPPPRPPRDQAELRVWDGNDCPPEMLDHPVVFVTAQDAVEFCRWLSERERREPLRDPPERLSAPAQYMLPTVPQWWALARSLGRLSLKDVCIDRGWIGIAANRQPTEPAAAGRPNSLGLHHLLGNVFEWCRASERSMEEETQFVTVGGGWASDVAWLKEHVKKKTALKCPTNYAMKDGGLRLWLDWR